MKRCIPKYLLFFIIFFNEKYISAQYLNNDSDSILINDLGFQITPNNDLTGYGEIENQTNKVIIVDRVGSNGGGTHIQLVISKENSIKLNPKQAAIFIYQSLILKSKFSNDTSVFFNPALFEPNIIVYFSYRDPVVKNSGDVFKPKRNNCRNLWKMENSTSGQFSKNELQQIKNKIKIESVTKFGFSISDEINLKKRSKEKKLYGAVKIINNSEFPVKIDSFYTSSVLDTIYSAFDNKIILPKQSLLCFYKSKIVGEKFNNDLNEFFKKQYEIKCKIYFKCQENNGEIPLIIEIKKENLINNI